MKNFTVKLVELGNPFLDIVDVRWGRFHRKQKNMIQNQLDMLRGDFRKIDLELEECLKRKTT